MESEAEVVNQYLAVAEAAREVGAKLNVDEGGVRFIVSVGGEDYRANTLGLVRTFLRGVELGSRTAREM